MGGFEWFAMVLEKIAPVMEWVVLAGCALMFLVIIAFVVVMISDDKSDRKHKMGIYDDEFFD